MKSATRMKVLLFLVIGAMAVVHVGVRYAGLGHLFNDDSYRVSVRLSDSGGIFERAEVTWRGVTVGRVDQVNFRRDGVTAVLRIDDAIKVPADLVAEVHNRSAVGEQYVDLVPRTDSGPYLADGDVIDTDRTTTPVSEEQLLASVDGFVESIDTGDLTTVVDELGAAFEGTGPDLRRTIDSADELVRSAAESLPATRALLRNGATVLATQDRQSALIGSSLTDLSTLTGIFARQDGDVRTILADAASAADQVRQLADGLRPVLGPVLANLVDIGTIAYDRQPQIESTLISIPWALASAQTPGRDGRAHFVLALAQNPTVCRRGYIPADQWRLPSDDSPVAASDDIGCAEGAPAVPRGVPRVLDPAESLDLPAGNNRVAPRSHPNSLTSLITTTITR